MYIYIYISIHTYIHTYIHMYVYTVLLIVVLHGNFHGAWEHLCFTKEAFFLTEPLFWGIGASKTLPITGHGGKCIPSLCAGSRVFCWKNTLEKTRTYRDIYTSL